MSVASFTLGATEISPGTRQTIDLPVSVLSNHTPITLPVHVIHGASPGPVMFISAVVHGDEILGVDIVRRVVRHSALAQLRPAPAVPRQIASRGRPARPQSATRGSAGSGAFLRVTFKPPFSTSIAS